MNSAYPEPSPLGSCARCGAEVYSDEVFPRLSAGQYLCTFCDEARCVMCGAMDALLNDAEDERVCIPCRESEARIAERRIAEFYRNNDWFEVFKGVKE